MIIFKANNAEIDGGDDFVIDGSVSTAIHLIFHTNKKSVLDNKIDK